MTGKPVWPIEEQPVEKGDVPGEWYSPTQPIPDASRRPTAATASSIEDLIDFTPALRDQALTLVAKYKIGPVFTPPVVSKVERSAGDAHAGHGERRHQLAGRLLRSGDAHGVRLRLQCLPDADRPGRRRRRNISDMNYVAGTAGQEVRMRTGPGENARRRFAACPRRAPAAAAALRRRRRWRRAHGAGSAADQAALRDHLGDQSGSAARSSGRSRMARRRTRSAIIRRSRA